MVRSTDALTGGYNMVYGNCYMSDGTCSNSNCSNSTTVTINHVGHVAHVAQYKEVLVEEPETTKADGPACFRSNRSKRLCIAVVCCIVCIVLASVGAVVYMRVFYKTKSNHTTNGASAASESILASTPLYDAVAQSTDNHLGSLLCGTHQCAFGAACVNTSDNTYQCQCPLCMDTQKQIVCGSDGKNYFNQCELSRIACQKNKIILRKFDGECDPCANHMCPEDKVCRLNDRRQPYCACGFETLSGCRNNQWLEQANKPVCGTDGITYSSYCDLLNSACKNHTFGKLLKHADGNCSSDHPCGASREICSMHEKCLISPDGSKHMTRRCIINNAEFDQDSGNCENVFRPVCGSDGETYRSECELQRVAVTQQLRITVVSSGVCDKSCSSAKCSNEDCSFDNDTVTHRCPQCRCLNYSPVCDNNGMTHDSECLMRKFACENGVSLQLKKYGMCNTCGAETCKFYSTCVAEGNGDRRKCVCPQESECDDANAPPVCASNDITYKNECFMRYISCKTEKYLVVKYHRPCYSMACSNNDECGSGMICSNSFCQARIAENYESNEISCVAGECNPANDPPEQLEEPVASDCTKKCSHGAVCKRDASTDEESCVCTQFCDRVPKIPVCGRSGSTFEVYENECILNRSRCLWERDIEIRPIDDCEDLVRFYSNFTLCDGFAPLMNNKTMKPLNCLNNQEVCPAGSYCHRNSIIGRCCPTLSDSIIVANQPVPCLCNATGSLNSSCDPRTLQCYCKPRYYGRSCDKVQPCAANQFSIDGECQACQCDLHGALYDRCDDDTGQCYCKMAFKGLKCSSCKSETAVLNGSICVEQSPPHVNVRPATVSGGAISEHSSQRSNNTRKVAYRNKQGSMCWRDSDCFTSVLGSQCLDGHCACFAGRVAADGGRRCVLSSSIFRSQLAQPGLQSERRTELNRRKHSDIGPDKYIEYRPSEAEPMRHIHAVFIVPTWLTSDAVLLSLVNGSRKDVAITLSNQTIHVYVCDGHAVQEHRMALATSANMTSDLVLQELRIKSNLLNDASRSQTQIFELIVETPHLLSTDAAESTRMNFGVYFGAIPRGNCATLAYQLERRIHVSSLRFNGQIVSRDKLLEHLIPER